MNRKIENLLLESLEKSDLEQKIENVDELIKIERPKESTHGHFSTNLARQLPRYLKMPPQKIANTIVDHLPERPELIDKVEIKGPGFINFFLTKKALQSIINEIKAERNEFGKNNKGKDKKTIVEFVSANPTGPLTVGHGRQAVLGDCVARILDWNGYDVHREYYYNDAGRQMRILGCSTYFRYRQLLGFDEEIPEDYYQGEYIKDVAQQIVDEFGDKYKEDKDAQIFREYAEKAVFADINNTLKSLGIEFDEYFNEKNLYESGKIDKVLEEFEEIGASYEKDGAIWFKGSEYGAEDDRVLWKSVADEATYRLPDMAYHKTKFERGFDRIVDIFGADHHATYPDVLAGLRALGLDVAKVEVIIHQFVTLMRGDEKVKMSPEKQIM